MSVELKVKVKVTASVKQLTRIDIPLKYAIDFVAIVAHETDTIFMNGDHSIVLEDKTWWFPKRFIKEL